MELDGEMFQEPRLSFYLSICLSFFFLCRCWCLSMCVYLGMTMKYMHKHPASVETVP